MMLGEKGSVASGDACNGKVQRVFLTGITGMIGSQLMKFLLRSPCRVVYGLVRWRSNLRNMAGYLDHPRLKLVNGDITDAFRMRELVEQSMPHYIYHFAAQAINGVSFTSPQTTLDVNVLGTLNLLEAMRANNLHASTRFLFASSSTVYGRTADDYDGMPIPESAPLQPISPYGVSKLASERLALQYFADYDVPVIAARLFIHVAPGGTEHIALQ